jgi:hypothetical protein
MKMTQYLVRLRSFFFVPCVAAILTVGCQGNAQLNPTAPTGPLGSTALTTDGAPDMTATASSAGDVMRFARGGNGNGTGNGNGNNKDKGGDSSDAELGDQGNGTKSNHGELSGFVTAVTEDSLTVRGITVLVDSETTVIRHGHRILTMADIHVGDHVQARGTLEGTTLEATEIKVEDTEHDDAEGEDDDEAEGEQEAGPGEVAGKVSELSGTCAAGLSFKVKTTLVTTSNTTTFTGVTCDALANGARVEVEGTRQANGSIAAASVKLD